MVNSSNQPHSLDKPDNRHTTSQSIPQIQVMSPPQPQALPRRTPRDTGFPEPFSKRSNTTLPHPDADLSPNACISHEEVSPDRTALKRNRLSFRSSRHKRTITSGFISPQHEVAMSVLSLGDSNRSSKELEREPSMLRSPSSSLYRFSKDGGESLSSRKDEDTPPTSPDGSELVSRRGLFKNWRNK